MSKNKKKCLHKWKDLAIIDYPPETSVICNNCGQILIQGKYTSKNNKKTTEGWETKLKKVLNKIGGRYWFLVKEKKNRKPLEVLIRQLLAQKDSEWREKIRNDGF